jgi:uncharacterized membrane protein
VRTGFVGLVVTTLGGVWLMLAPYLVGFHRTAHNPWPTPVLVSVVAGAFVTAASLVGLVGYLGLTLRELQQAARSRAEKREAREA